MCLVLVPRHDSMADSTIRRRPSTSTEKTLPSRSTERAAEEKKSLEITQTADERDSDEDEEEEGVGPFVTGFLGSQFKVDNAEHEALLTSDGGAAATSDGDGGTTTSATADADVPSPAKPIDFDFDGFVKLCLEDIEKVVAQELYGKDMVSIVDDIRHQKEAMVRHSSVHGFRDGFTTTSAEGNRPSQPRSC